MAQCTDANISAPQHMQGIKHYVIPAAKSSGLDYISNNIFYNNRDIKVQISFSPSKKRIQVNASSLESDEDQSQCIQAINP